MDPQWELRPERNLLDPVNVARVTARLHAPNIMLGFHHFYYGGGAPDLLAYSSAEAYLDRVKAARPGDAFEFYFLDALLGNAILVIGHAESRDPIDRLEERLVPVVAAVEAKKEIVAVWRAHLRNGSVLCAAEILWDLTPDEWRVIRDNWSARAGEMSFFDICVLYQVAEAAQRAREAKEELPEGLAAEGKRPDEHGFTPAGGAY